MRLSPEGERLVGRVPHWKKITFVAALRHNAMTAPFIIEGADLWLQLPQR